jgi:hypothetical protein
MASRSTSPTPVVAGEPAYCARCDARHGSPHRGTSSSPPRLLSDLNEKLYYSRKDLRATSAQKLLDRHLREYGTGDNSRSKASFTRDEVAVIVQRLYVDQIRSKEALLDQLRRDLVDSKDVVMPRRQAAQISEIVARLSAKE